MAEDYGASVADWLKVVRRARLGRTVKAVAYAVATRANNDGTKVFPGIARLSVECELSPKVIKEALKALRDGGLLEVVKAATTRGEATEYRLTLGPQVLESFEVPTPAAHDLEVERVAAMLRGKWRGTPNLRGTGDPAGSDTGDDLRGTACTAGGDALEGPAGYGADDKSEPAGYGTTNLRGTPYPATSHVPLRVTTSPSDDDARTAVTGPREREAANEPDSSDGVGGGPAAIADPLPLGRAGRVAQAAAERAARAAQDPLAERLARILAGRTGQADAPTTTEPVDPDALMAAAVAERQQQLGQVLPFRRPVRTA